MKWVKNKMSMFETSVFILSFCQLASSLEAGWTTLITSSWVVAHASVSPEYYHHDQSPTSWGSSQNSLQELCQPLAFVIKVNRACQSVREFSPCVRGFWYDEKPMTMVRCRQNMPTSVPPDFWIICFVVSCCLICTFGLIQTNFLYQGVFTVR